jgi:hypothetical protein
MNRYSNYEVSAYKPQTAQEIWAVPAAMRQQHNAADEKLQTQIAELDKVNPLDVHYDKAQKIKSDLIKQIETQSSALATEGFNGNTTSGVYKTNRQLHEQFSPTGELGQINAAKTAYDTEKATYLDDATKVSKIGREQALKNWNNYAKNKYTGYSEDGKKISNIGALGSPAYQDYETDRNQYHALLGKITSSARASGHAIVPDKTTGLLMMVNRGGNVVHSDNVDALNNAMRGMKDKWVSEAGEGRKWADAAGWDPNHTNYRINQDFNAMKEISNVDNRTENYDVLSGQTPNAPQGIGEGPQPVSLPNATTSKANEELLHKMKGTTNNAFPTTPTPVGFIGAIPQQQEYSKGVTSEIFKKSVKSPEYIAIANGLNRSLPANKQFKRGSEAEFNAVAGYLEKHKNLTTQNSYIAPFTSKTGLLFADKSLTKDVGEASKEILNRIGNKAVDVYIDSPDGGKTKVKIDPSTISNFEYSGDMSPESYVNAFPNPKQNIMPHYGVVTIGSGDKAKKVAAYVSRDPKDFSSSQYKGAKDINTVKNAIRVTPGIFKHLNTDAISGFKNHGMKDVLIKYNAGSKTYDVNFKYPVKDSEGNEKLTTMSMPESLTEDALNSWLITLNE